MKINTNLKIIVKIFRMMDSFTKKYQLPKRLMIKSKTNTLTKSQIKREN